MADHGVGLHKRHKVDHVLALGLQGDPASLPGVAAVEEQHIAVAAFGANRLYDGRDPVEAAEPAIGLGQRFEIGAGHGVGFRRTVRDAKIVQEIRVRKMGRRLRIADADVNGWLAEVDRPRLGVEIGDVKDGEIAELLRGEESI